MLRPSESTPPGLEGNLECVSSGGDTLEWLNFTEKKDYTNAFIVHKHQILLGYKKRGFGKNLYEIFFEHPSKKPQLTSNRRSGITDSEDLGGKVEPGETSHQAALRELEEEAGIIAPLQHAGTLLFTTGINEAAFHIEIYRADEFAGVVTETDEMRPEWFSLPSADPEDRDAVDAPSIPYDKMWEDDPHWMPLLISKTKFAGRADFVRKGDGYAMNKWWFGTVADN